MSRVYLSISKFVESLGQVNSNFVDVVFNVEEVTTSKFGQKTIKPLAILFNNSCMLYDSILDKFEGHVLIQFNETKTKTIGIDEYQILRIDPKLSEYNDFNFHKAKVLPFKAPEKLKEKIINNYETNKGLVKVYNDPLDDEIDYNDFEFI